MKKNEAIALLKGPYGREISNIASSYTSAINWPSGPSAVDIDNGSIFFLDCGSGPLAVTAYHVYEGYLKRKKLNSRLKCKIGSVSFVPEDRLIDRDQELDIVTFTIDKKEVEADGKVIHRVDPNNWPPKPPDIGKGIFFAGYPKEYRRAGNSKEYVFGTYVGVLTATLVNEQHIACQFDRDEIVDMFGNDELPKRQFLGGLSGAPLWTLVQTNIFSWRLGGIIYKFNPEFDLLYARRPDCILTDGQILR
jgi:hypothetical protein